MKKCIDIVKDWVMKVSSNVTNIEITYGMNQLLNYHIVIVKPSQVYHSNKKYMELEQSFYDEVYSLFPDENIIITDDEFVMEITEHIISRDNHQIERPIVRIKYEYNSSNCNRTHNEGSYALAA